MKSLEFGSTANQTSDRSRLKVDGSRWNVEELTTFNVQYVDRLWIKGIEFLKETDLNCVAQ